MAASDLIGGSSTPNLMRGPLVPECRYIFTGGVSANPPPTVKRLKVLVRCQPFFWVSLCNSASGRGLSIWAR